MELDDYDPTRPVVVVRRDAGHKLFVESGVGRGWLWKNGVWSTTERRYYGDVVARAAWQGHTRSLKDPRGVDAAVDLLYATVRNYRRNRQRQRAKA